MVKAVAVGDTIGGKTVTGLNFTRSTMFGDPIAFRPTFDDASQALYLSAELSRARVGRGTLERLGEHDLFGGGGLHGSRFIAHTCTI